MRRVPAGQDVDRVSDQADGDAHGVDADGDGAVLDVVVPEARRPTTFDMKHFKFEDKLSIDSNCSFFFFCSNGHT